ncbi:MAG: RelA/SpoT domain-containing protein [Thermoanaerobaculia bacterium]
MMPLCEFDKGAVSPASFASMGWATPHFSPEEIDAAGAVLASHPAGETLDDALSVINNWRSSHAFPLNTLQMGLRRKARAADPGHLVAQRVKRLSSIQAKLARFPWLKLSEMQDLGGCRAVVKSVKEVDRLVDIHTKSRMFHRLDHMDNYISDPKKSGYRGVHLIYRYQSDYNTAFNGLKIEVQIRSLLQHAWATAVETVGTLMGESLKSSQGPHGWLRFFALMGSEIALRERRPTVPKTPSSREELVTELKECAHRLEAVRRLATYSAAIQAPEIYGAKNAKYFLMVLDATARTVSVTGYQASEHERALSALGDRERNVAGTALDAVLVSAESASSLRRAYPNYFLDMRTFIGEVRKAVSEPA